MSPLRPRATLPSTPLGRSVAALWLAFMFALPAQTAGAQMGEPGLYGMFRAEQLEASLNGDSNPISWDVSSWVGADWNRLWFKSEGDVPTNERAVEFEAQLLYSRLIAPFWELQVGVRADLLAEPGNRAGRAQLVLGLQGLARYWFELEPAIFISQRGDVSARVRASYDVFITQRLIFQPDVEFNVAIQSVPEFGVGAGFNDLQIGLRFRYEFVRKFAPYLGMNWQRSFGQTARMARTNGEGARDLRGVLGLRVWF